MTILKQTKITNAVEDARKGELSLVGENAGLDSHYGK
jgi:hypothetical protein